MLQTIQHLTENDTADTFEFSGLFQMGRHAIDLLGFGIYMLNDEDRVLGMDFVFRSQSRHQKRQASPHEPSFPVARPPNRLAVRGTGQRWRASDRLAQQLPRVVLVP